MNYEKGYLAMFSALTALTEQLKKISPESEMPVGHEWVNVPQCLRTIQQKGEEACIQ